MFFVKLPQNRHPERSASQIDCVTLRLWRGVEEPVPREAEGTPTVLSYPCCSELFNHRARTGPLAEAIEKSHNRSGWRFCGSLTCRAGGRSTGETARRQTVELNFNSRRCADIELGILLP
jgi:hypothetical protein